MDGGLVLVVGATGQLGSVVTRKLCARSTRVRALARPDARIGYLKALSVEISYGDLLDAESLRRACEGVDCIVATATAAIPRKSTDSLRVVDGEGYRRLIDAARACGVQQFIHTSVCTVPGGDKIPLFRQKRDTEQYLTGRGPAFTIIRAAPFMDVVFALMGSDVPLRGVEVSTVERPFWFSRRFFEGIRGDLDRGQLGVLGAGNTRHSFIAINDVAECLVRSRDERFARNAIFEVGGPEALTMRDVVALYEAVVNRKLRVRSTPTFVLGALGAAMRPFSEAASNILALNRLMAKADSVVPGAHETAARFGIPLTTAESFLCSKWRSRGTESD
jgi:uncharacterized protein YbjT (DUF2867 family)